MVSTYTTCFSGNTPENLFRLIKLQQAICWCKNSTLLIEILLIQCTLPSNVNLFPCGPRFITPLFSAIQKDHFCNLEGIHPVFFIPFKSVFVLDNTSKTQLWLDANTIIPIIAVTFYFASSRELSLVDRTEQWMTRHHYPMKALLLFHRWFLYFAYHQSMYM